jgi:hypothetical protein
VRYSLSEGHILVQQICLFAAQLAYPAIFLQQPRADVARGCFYVAF